MMTCGIYFQNWISDATYERAFKVACALEIVAVKWNRTTDLTQADNPWRVNLTAGSWHWDRTYLWVRPPEDTTSGRQTTRIALDNWFWWRNPSSYSVFVGAVQAFAAFYFATNEKILDNRHYDPRVLSAPDLSQRIEPRFGGIAQIGGGNLILANVDRYFDSMQDYQWDAGTVTMRIGVDLPSGDMAASDYQMMATWSPESWRTNEKEFILKLIEPKNRFKTQLPYTFFDRTTYPNIDQEWVGKAIPIYYGKVYGKEAIPVDVGSKRFKLCGHTIREISAIRLRTSREQANSRDVPVSSWFLYSGTTYRYYLAGEEARNVKFNGTSMTKVNAVTDCTATAGTWATEGNYIYVNPSGGQTISSGTYTVESALQVDSWQTSNYVTADLTNGEFTLGTDWTIGTDVSVDLIGKVDPVSGLLADGVSVLSDIFSLIGQTAINSASVTTAKARLKAGTDESGQDSFIRVVGVAIMDAQEAEDIIKEILRAINGYLLTDENGQVSINIFEPQPGENLEQIDDTDIEEFQEETDKFNATKVNIQYAPRTKDDWKQLYSLEAVALGYIHNQPSAVVFDDESNLLTETADVQSFAQRYLLLDARPLKQWIITIPWRGLLWKPGRQIHVSSVLRNFEAILEIIEIKINLADKRCQLTLGNLRGYGDQPGFWVDDAAALPTRFSALAGYGTGSLTWNKNWHRDIKTWARQNVGYWTDENGFADSTDPDSQITSTWI